MHPNFTYGELCSGELKRILSYCSLKSIKEFWDLGSGQGEVCQQALELNIFQKIHGLEYLPQRLALALKKRNPDIFFQWADLHTPLSKPETPSMVYLCATCFENSLLQAISKSVTRYQEFRICASLKPLPLSSSNWKVPKIVRVSCSWDDALCYIYERRVNA